MKHATDDHKFSLIDNSQDWNSNGEILLLEILTPMTNVCLAEELHRDQLQAHTVHVNV